MRDVPFEVALVDQVGDDALDLVKPHVLLTPLEPQLHPLQFELVGRLDGLRAGG